MAFLSILLISFHRCKSVGSVVEELEKWLSAACYEEQGAKDYRTTGPRDQKKMRFFQHKGWDWFVAAILLVAPFVVYSPLMEAGYIWDDNALVTENRNLRSLDGLWRIR